MSDFSALVPAHTSSPFDAIRRVDEQGEHWTGRDLQSLAGYLRWEDFRNAIERARLSITNSGRNADQAASAYTEPVVVPAASSTYGPEPTGVSNFPALR